MRCHSRELSDVAKMFSPNSQQCECTISPTVQSAWPGPVEGALNATWIHFILSIADNNVLNLPSIERECLNLQKNILQCNPFLAILPRPYTSSLSACFWTIYSNIMEKFTFRENKLFSWYGLFVVVSRSMRCPARKCSCRKCSYCHSLSHTPHSPLFSCHSHFCCSLPATAKL